MAKDVICSEDELTIASNKISAYSDFLARMIEEYVGILKNIQDLGIKDNEISAKLAYINSLISPLKSRLDTESTDIASLVSQYVDDIAEADNFQFPSELEAIISSTVARFK